MTKQTKRIIAHPEHSKQKRKQKPSIVEAVILGLSMAIIIVFIVYTQGVALAFWPFWVVSASTLVAGALVFAGKITSSVAKKAIIVLAFLQACAAIYVLYLLWSYASWAHMH